MKNFLEKFNDNKYKSFQGAIIAHARKTLQNNFTSRREKHGNIDINLKKIQ